MQDDYQDAPDHDYRLHDFIEAQFKARFPNETPRASYDENEVWTVQLLGTDDVYTMPVGSDDDEFIFTHAITGHVVRFPIPDEDDDEPSNAPHSVRLDMSDGRQRVYSCDSYDDASELRSLLSERVEVLSITITKA